MADWSDTVTEKSYYGLIDIRGNWLMPLRLGRLRYINEEKTILLHYYECRESDAKRDTTIYNYVYDLVRQRELAFDPKEMDSVMNGSKEICAYVDGKRFVKKEMDGKSRVVMMDTAGRILRILPLGVYDCQPWSEGLSVVRLKDGQFLRYGLMDADGNLTFRKEELAEAERLAFAQLSLPSWPELKLDSQWIAEQSQLLEEAYQEKSEEKKQLFVFHFKNVGQFYPRMVDTVGLIFPGVPAISQIVSDFIFRKNGESFDSLHCRCEPWCCRMLFLFVPVNDLDSGYFGDDPYPHVTTIVFSKGMKQAMVGFRTGDRSGKIGYCLLKRKGRKWKAIRYVTPIEYI